MPLPTKGSSPAMRLLVWFGAVSAFILAVPLVGLAISYPLWYVSTHHRLLYTLVIGGAVAGAVIRYGIQKRTDPTQ